VWVDANSDGVSQAAELKSLGELGIASLDLKAQATSLNSNGNWVGLTSGYTTVDGVTNAMADVWFQVDGSETGGQGGLAQAITSFAAAQATAVSGVGGAIAPLAGVSGAALSSSVSAIVDAMTQFNASVAGGNLNLPTTSATQGLTTGLTNTSVTGQSENKKGVLGSGGL
jgi:hypothetical protein